MSPDTASPPAKRKRGNPLFPLLSRVYKFWTDRFRHDPKYMTPAARKRNIAAFTIAVKAQVLEANPNGVTSRDFKQAVEHVKARLGPEAWPAELDKAAGRIEAAILAYADSGYHRKQAERQAASPRRHFDNWLHEALTTWIDAARTTGLIDRDGVAKHVRVREPAAENKEPIDVDALLAHVRDRLLSDNNRGLRQFRQYFEPAGTKRANDHRHQMAAISAAHLVASFPDAVKSDLFRLIDQRAHQAWKKPVERNEGRWNYQLARFLNECLNPKGDKDV